MAYKEEGCLLGDEIVRFVRGEIPDEEKLAIENHLRDCGVCDLNVRDERRLQPIEKDVISQGPITSFDDAAGDPFYN